MKSHGRTLSLARLSLIFLLMISPHPAAAQSGAWSSIAGHWPYPGPRREFAAAFDRKEQRFMLLCGFNGNNSGLYLLFNDVWALSVVGTPTWSQLAIGGTLPGPRHSPQWGYDAARNRFLIFGGYGKHYVNSASFEYLNDVWQLDLNGTPTWTELFPSGQTPTGRLAGAAVFDPRRQRFVGFGGTIGAPVDTWVLNMQGQGIWQPLPSQGSRPNGGWGMTSVYDSREDRMIIFGGSIGDGYYGSNNDVWSLDLKSTPKWTKLVTTGTPPIPRRSAAAIFDPLRNRMVVYGGFDAVMGSDRFLADAWALDLATEPPTWTELSPTGVAPTQRDATAAAYDPIHDRMIFFGGWSGSTMLDDLQFLDWSEPSSEAALESLASTTPTSASVTWNSTGTTGVHAAVYRKVAGGTWTAVALAESSPSGQIQYTDTDVLEGGQYSYMAMVASQRGETFGGQTQVTLPITTGVGPGGVATFAIDAVRPNPAVAHMVVSYTLSNSESASLELVDVSGRRWLDQDLGAMGSGTHQLDIATAGRYPPGLYFLRLRQSGRLAVSRVVISAPR